MAELKRIEIEEELPTAEVASDDIPAKQLERPKLVKGQEPKLLDRTAAISESMPLFAEPETVDFRSQWSKLQTGFAPDARSRRQAGSRGAPPAFVFPQSV